MSAAGPATAKQTVELAEQVMEVLETLGHEAVMIGGYALAVHNYLRATEDLDLGVVANLTDLVPLRNALLARGFAVELRLPDAGDALGGVIDVRDEHDAFVQIVNFYNEPGGFPKVIRDALKSAAAPRPGSRLRVVPLPQLIALKLYAGGPQSMSDVRELLAKNPDADVAAIKSLCNGYGLATDALDL